MDFELDQKVENLKPGEKIVATYEKTTKSKQPPWIKLGSGLTTKKFPEGTSVDALKVFSELSKDQRQLFIDFKDILSQQTMDNIQAKRSVDNPNLVPLSRSKDNEFHRDIRDRMSQRKNGTTLEEKGVLKRLKIGVYMLNPYIFIPSGDFEKVAKIWEELPAKD